MQFIIENQVIRWLCGCLIFFNTGCNEAVKPPAAIQLSKKDSAREIIRINRAVLSVLSVNDSIQTGDLITRTGNDFTSESLRSLNRREVTYSHCGIASIENDSVFVYHALGGEWNPDQKIRRDPLLVFAEPYSNRGIGLFQFNISETLKKAIANEARNHFNNGVKFDMDFDLASNDRMYCAEFVVKTYEKGSGKLLKFAQSRIGKFAFVGVDDIFLHPLCTPRTKIVYKY